MKLAELMEKRGISGRELSKKSGVHYVQIMGYLRTDPKQGKLPSIGNLIKIARALNCSLETLTGLESLKGIERDANAVGELSAEEKAVIEAYNSLPDDDWRRKAVDEILLKTKEVQQKKNSKDKAE